MKFQAATSVVFFFGVGRAKIFLFIQKQSGIPSAR
jgi:hypothetical protein